MSEIDLTLVNIEELPSGNPLLSNKIMFGIGAILHTATLQQIKTLIEQELPDSFTKIKQVNIFPHEDFNTEFAEDEFLAVKNAINFSLSTYYGGEITTEEGEALTFRILESSYFEPEPGILIPQILWRYYTLTTGVTSFTGIDDQIEDLRPDGVVFTRPDDFINLSDIDDATIEAAFNDSVEAPFSVSPSTYIQAVQDGVLRVWKWIGGTGQYGGVGTPAVEQDFVLLANTTSISPKNAFALRFISLDGINTDQDELLWVADAAAQSAIDLYGGTITCNDGEQMVFFVELLVGMSVQRRYYALNSGDTSFTGVSSPYLDLTPLGRIEQNLVENPLVVDLGDIGATAVHTAFNADASEPFEMNNDRFIIAETSTGDKVWKWVGGSGSFGASATPATADDFVDLTEQSDVVSDNLPPKEIDSDDYEATTDDLNRLLRFTQNTTAFDIPETLAEQASDAGIVSSQIRGIFLGTGTHTVTAYNGVSVTFQQGEVFFAELIGDGTQGWYVKGLGIIPNLQQVTDVGNITENNILVSIEEEDFPNLSERVLISKNYIESAYTTILIIPRTLRLDFSASDSGGGRGVFKFPDLGGNSTENILATIEQFTDADTETDPDTVLAVKAGNVVRVADYGIYLIPTATASNEITFDKLRVFGTPASPRDGNITEDLTGALSGIIQKMYHDDVTEPTYPAGWVLVGGDYVTNELNIIYAEWISGTRVEFWVTQEQ